MPDEGHRDKLVDEVTDKVMSRPGVDADESEVRPRAEEAVDRLVDAPVQTFTPVLAEHQVVGEVHASHREEPDDEPDGRETTDDEMVTGEQRTDDPA